MGALERWNVGALVRWNSGAGKWGGILVFQTALRCCVQNNKAKANECSIFRAQRLRCGAAMWYNILMNTRPNSSVAPRPLGVIESFSAGISVMLRNPSLVLLPLLLDLFFWVGPPLVLGPELVEAVVAPFDSATFAAEGELGG